jgi:hypothetical protein
MGFAGGCSRAIHGTWNKTPTDMSEVLMQLLTRKKETNFDNRILQVFWGGNYERGRQ